MADNKGIIFGDYFLSYDLFEPIFVEWYAQKREDFRQALETLVIKPIEDMVVIENGKVVSKHGAAVRIKGQYKAKQIYENWEKLSHDYFGNSPVTLLIGAKFQNDQYQWTNTIHESDIVNDKGINVRKKALQTLQEANENIEIIYAAAEVQDIINSHIENMMKQLEGYQLSKPDAIAMHQLLAAKQSVLNNASFHFTGSTYNKIIFSSQQNAEGKQLDAFMNHMGNYHAEIFQLLSPMISGTNLINSTIKNIDNDFPEVFANPDKVQPWLLDSLNSASWLTGGDIIVLDSTGKVIYNIQLKTTKRGKTFEVATSTLYKFAIEMRNLINQDASPEELAKLMFDKLATTAANQAPQIEKFYENKIYENVEKNLNMKNGSLNLDCKIKL